MPRSSSGRRPGILAGSANDWDRLAGAVVAGHVVECGTQCTGGNYAFFQEVPGLEHPGFPIAEMHDDGSSVITKHDGTGGLVSVGTVTAQLLYEIDKPPVHQSRRRGPFRHDSGWSSRGPTACGFPASAASRRRRRRKCA